MNGCIKNIAKNDVPNSDLGKTVAVKFLAV